ncbi:tetratricopeptide repeat protein [Micromonospora purpureochromogenes]|uniref:Tetratricopeptide (TPR) repeat protein n=1 Tax=Micromonospora purpureochromogenes TaxID=47872 RepID=A0ABX2RV09_9ACTN|nr:tetratricopeptide repeat protein [Micromonospora purpureochromogenes]NYF59860.1 tetratricopeptide (TPR) repeat protein [Micromonospora purpureochromogenes]
MTGDPRGGPRPAGYAVTNTGDAWAGAPGSVAVSGYVEGDVFAGLPGYRLTALPCDEPPAHRELRLAELLDARHRVVPFVGRDAERRWLREWLAASATAPDFAALLIHGPGGQGKTRLADRFAADARATDWEVLRAHRDPGPPAPGGPPARGGRGDGLLVIVDYADRWPAGELRRLFTDPRLRRDWPVRVLVLARTQGYWWPALRQWLDTIGVRTGESALAPLAVDPTTRERLFRAAAARFAELVPHARLAAVTTPDLSDPAYETALAVQLAALVAVDASRDGGPVPSTLVDLHGYLLDREIGHWQQLREGGATSSPPDQLARAVFTATLIGAVPYEVGREILAGAGIGAEPVVEELLADHGTCYPSREPAYVLAPLQPDRLGEAYLALAVPGHAWPAHLPRPWANRTARALLRAEGMSPATATLVRANALTVLTEVSTAWRHVATAVLLPALRAEPRLAIAAGGAVLARIVDLPDADVDLLAAIEPVLPDGRHVDFDIVACDITARLVAHRLPGCADDVERTQLHLGYGRRLANVGRREAALVELTRAVTAGEAALRAEASRATSALLARALHLRGHRLAALNRYPEALASVERAVELLAPLADAPGANGEAHRRALAETLGNLGTRLSNVGRDSEAVVVARRAVDLFEAGPRSVAAELGLAGALTNLAVIEAQLGLGREALKTVRRAEGIWRRLSDDEPSVYLPELALALNTVGLRHADLGQVGAAVDAAEASLSIYRDLVRVNAVAFELDLAAVLANLSGYLWQLGRRTEALGANSQAEEVFARWGGANPEAFSVHLRHVRENIARMNAQRGPADLRRWELGAHSFAS